MNKIAVVTDTDSSLPPSLAGQYGIQLVPITVHFEDSAIFTTGVDIDDQQLFEMIDRRNKLPTTSAPTPGAFSIAYEEAFRAGAESIICICVSSKVSATVTSAQMACELFPGRDISVIDSLNLTMGQGFMALAAAEAIQRGASKAEAVQHALDTGKSATTYVLLSTLKYLAMSGRVGKIAAGMGDTLNIKPILTIQDGTLDLLERIRTYKKGLLRMVELVNSAVQGKTIKQVAFLHVNNLEGAREFENQLSAVINLPQPVITAELTPGLSVHGGAGAVGVTLVAV
jgi:DegV family protein with EDD domain